jgi:AcrR family transcriptional regulator
MPTRRDRLRAQTLEEISEHAWAQVDRDGAAALSSNAIAKAMGMSGPAMYRYFASRDALLQALVGEAYRALVAVMAEAAAASARKAPAKRIVAVCAAYRAWALAHPRRYAMLFEPRPGDVADTEEAIGEIHGGMALLLGLLGELAGDAARSGPSHPDKLDRQLARWATLRDVPLDLPPHVLRLGVLAWTRLHGVVALEIAGVFADMQLDAGLLVDAEIDAVIAAVAATAA